MNKKSGVRKLISGAALIVVQAALIIIHVCTDTLYLPNLDGISAFYVLPLAIYYIGYFMIGICGVYLIALGLYDPCASKVGVPLYDKKGFKSATAAIYPLAFPRRLQSLFCSRAK